MAGEWLGVGGGNFGGNPGRGRGVVLVVVVVVVVVVPVVTSDPPPLLSHLFDYEGTKPSLRQCPNCKVPPDPCSSASHMFEHLA